MIVLKDSYVSPERTAPEKSPIDRAYDAMRLVTQIAGDLATRGQWTPQVGLMLSASVVAGAEDYFRSILTDLPQRCRLTRDRVSAIDTRLEFVFSGEVSEALRSVLDEASFSSKENVRDWTKKIVGVDPSKVVSLGDRLDEFERICHVRHCAVHSGGYVSGRNSEKLDVPKGSWLALTNPAAIHEMVAVATAVVRSYNQSMFDKVLGSWIDQGVLVGNWQEDKAQFDPLWKIFWSESDCEVAKTVGGAEIRETSYGAYRSISRVLRARNGLD